MLISFQPIMALSHAEPERGGLVWVQDVLAAFIIEAEGGWFLHGGFGPFDAEGLLFADIAALERWMTERLAGAPPTPFRIGPPSITPGPRCDGNLLNLTVQLDKASFLIDAETVSAL